MSRIASTGTGMGPSTEGCVAVLKAEECDNVPGLGVELETESSLGVSPGKYSLASTMEYVHRIQSSKMHECYNLLHTNNFDCPRKIKYCNNRWAFIFHFNCSSYVISRPGLKGLDTTWIWTSLALKSKTIRTPLCYKSRHWSRIDSGGWLGA